MTLRSREIRLKSRPTGQPGPENFELAEAEAASPADGQVQVRNLWMSVDPYMRGRMTDRPSYVPPFQLGEPLQGGAVGEVVASRADGFAPGDLVQSMLGWREAFTAPAQTLQKLDAHGLPPEAFLGVAGMPGMTAWVGLTKIAQLQEGETVFVSAAAGGSSIRVEDLGGGYSGGAFVFLGPGFNPGSPSGGVRGGGGGPGSVK